MELIFEFIGEICFGILGSIIESDRVPKWMRYTLIGLLISGPIALCVSIMIRNQDIVTTILMCLIILAIIALFAAAVHTVYRSGILRPAKEEDVPEVLKMYCSVIGKPGCNWSISYPNEATLHEDFSTGNLYVLWRGSKTELCMISQETADMLNRAKAEGGRIICVGTTSCRTLESLVNEDGTFEAKSKWTEIFIYPGYTFKAMQGLITNFHLPESTLVMLVSAFAGREKVLNAYEEAVKERYRFFSFGDAMFIG